MSEQVRPQLVWLPDGFGGGKHVHVCCATDYAALEAENENLRLSWGLLRSENNALRQQRDKLAGLLGDLAGAARSVNSGPRHALKVEGDDEPVYPQRAEWVEWLKELGAAADAALAEIKP